MRELLIIDGYNIINAWNGREPLTQQRLEAARDALCARLSGFCAYYGWDLLIVFDAHLSGGPESVETQGHMQVVYTRRGETADGYIERYVRQTQGVTRVATNDALEQTMILGAGAVRMSAKELLAQVLSAEREYAAYAPITRAPLELRLSAEARESLEDWRRR